MHFTPRNQYLSIGVKGIAKSQWFVWEYGYNHSYHLKNGTGPSVGCHLIALFEQRLFHPYMRNAHYTPKPAIQNTGHSGIKLVVISQWSRLGDGDLHSDDMFRPMLSVVTKCCASVYVVITVAGCTRLVTVEIELRISSLTFASLWCLKVSQKSRQVISSLLRFYSLMRAPRQEKDSRGTIWSFLMWRYQSKKFCVCTLWEKLL